MLVLLIISNYQILQNIVIPEPTIYITETRERKPYIKAVKGNKEAGIIVEKSYITSKQLPAAMESPGVARPNAAVSLGNLEGDLEWARKCDGCIYMSIMPLRSITLVLNCRMLCPRWQEKQREETQDSSHLVGEAGHCKVFHVGASTRGKFITVFKISEDLIDYLCLATHM